MTIFILVLICTIFLICHRTWAEAASGHSEAFFVHLEEEKGKGGSI
jgi:hypothetical protein